MRAFNEKYIPLTIFFALSIIYAGFLTKNYYWDGITFATDIENAKSLSAALLHPSHLVYNIFGYLVYGATRFLGFDVRAVTVLQVCNCLFSALTATVLYLVFKELFRSAYVAVLLVCVFAFSATWWKFSTDADAYIPSIFFLVVSFWLIVPGKKPRPFAVAFAHVAAMCFHQLAIFFFPVILIGLYIQSRDDDRKRLFNVLEYTFIAVVSIAGIYCLSFYLLTGSFGVRDLIGWMTYYSTENGFVFNAGQSASWTLSGTMKLFFGGRLSFFREIANPVTILLAAIDMIALAALTVVVIAGIKKRSNGEFLDSDDISSGHSSLIAAVWVFSYTVFLFFWIPKNVFYRLFYLVPLVVLLGVWMSRSRFLRVNRAVPALFVTVLMLSNFLFFILPHSRVRSETPMAMAMKMNEVWSSKSVIFFLTPDSDSNMIRYFNPTTTWKQISKIEPESFDAELLQIYANGGDAWIEHSVHDAIARDEALSEWLKKYSITACRINDPIYNVVFEKVMLRPTS